TNCPEVEPVLCGKNAAQRLPRPEMVESAVALDGARNLEGRRAQQANPFANLAVERNHHLGGEEAVVPGPPSRGVVDIVAQEVAWPDRRSGHPERGARDLV